MEYPDKTIGVLDGEGSSQRSVMDQYHTMIYNPATFPHKVDKIQTTYHGVTTHGDESQRSVKDVMLAQTYVPDLIRHPE